MSTADEGRSVKALSTKMRQGGVCLGLLIKMPSPALVELAGFAGFDFVLIDMEHGPDDHISLEHHIRAADAAQIPTIVRVGVLEGALIGRVLDSGASGIVVPHLGSANDAQHAVRAAHYPPFGRRGLATSTRAGRQTMLTIPDHLAASESGTIVIGQIEDAEAVSHAAEIAQTEHLDCVWIGPNDLSQSIGKPRDHPDFLRAETTVVDAVRGLSGTALAVLADGVEDARRWIEDRGATVIIFSSVNFIAGALNGLIRSMTESVGSSPTRDGTDQSSGAIESGVA